LSQDILESDFLVYVKNMILKEDKYDQDSIEAELHSEIPILFDNVELTYGTLKVKRIDEGFEGKLETYLFLSTDLNVQFPDLKA
jgi:hypothetical protein